MKEQIENRLEQINKKQENHQYLFCEAPDNDKLYSIWVSYTSENVKLRPIYTGSLLEINAFINNIEN